VRCQEQGHSIFVGFEHAVLGVVLGEGGELDDGHDHEDHVVVVVVVQENLPHGKSGRGLFRGGWFVFGF